MSNLGRNGRRVDVRKELGRKAEQAACEHLLKQGFAIVERNWRCRTGEIDIIASNGKLLIIVEVRSRSQQAAAFGTPPNRSLPEKSSRFAIRPPFIFIVRDSLPQTFALTWWPLRSEVGKGSCWSIFKRLSKVS